jgi:ribosomal protein S12 methylthiotransferase accessory factor
METVRVKSSEQYESARQIELFVAERIAQEGLLWQSGQSIKAVIDVGMIGAPRRSAERKIEKVQDEMLFPIGVARSGVFLGPFFNGDGPCPVCLERRWTALRPAEERRVLEGIDRAPEGLVVGQNPWLTPFVLKAIWEITRYAFAQYGNDADATPASEFHVLDMETLRVVRSYLVADSLCPVCSSKETDTAASAVLHLSSRLKRDTQSYRLTGLNEIDLQDAAYINHFCGVVGRYSTKQHTAQVVTAPVAGHYQICDIRGDHSVWWRGHSNIYGMSRKVGMLEGLERYVGLLPRNKEISVFDSLANLGDDALNPEECGLYPDSYYRNAPLNTRFSPDLKVHWVWGYSLTQARSVLVPKQMVYYMDYTRPEPTFVQDSSSGCATGSCLEEAILFGLLELLERDSFMLAWNAELALPKIDPWSSRRRETLLMLDRVERMGYDIHFLDMRLDLKIPAVMCLALRRDRELGSMVLAAGAGFDPEDAISSALGEVATYASDFQTRVMAQEESMREMAEDYRKVTVLADHAPLYGLPEMADKARSFLLRNPLTRTVEETYRVWVESEMPRNRDLLADVQYFLELLKSAGLGQVIVVDQTSTELERLGLKTVCVLVPGLLPIDFGYERQRIRSLSRLRTVPRTTGFRATDLSPEEINVLPHPFP